MKFIVLLISFLILTSCVQEEEDKHIKSKEWSADHSVDFNKEVHKREELAIEIYLAHHKDLKNEKYWFGLRYQLAENRVGNGDKARIETRFL